jgi:transcriptional regulator with XRE-family HTH domain
MDIEKKKKNKKLGIFIKQERDAKSLSLREFAKKVGVSHVAISHIENGKVEAKKETLVKIARILNYDKDKLLAKASKIDDDIEEMLYEKSNSVPSFLRTAKDLTEEQIKTITKQMKKMRESNS